ncbi:unnamed protein product [Urochloa decumbens]|uniref:F-box domain-containing protein n=1 Tax=Urochloa decumbens TaxID=240449 RepID=A0ABC9BU82_9POAL
METLLTPLHSRKPHSAIPHRASLPPHFRRRAAHVAGRPGVLPPPPPLRGTLGVPPAPWHSQFVRAGEEGLRSGGGMFRKDAAAAAARCVPALPEEIIAEILARVPPDAAFLFRCAFVCKRWRRLLSDPALLRRLFPEAGRSSLLGVLVQRHRPSVAVLRAQRLLGLLRSRVPAFVPASGSALGPRNRLLTSFVRDGAGLLENTEPLAVRDGLLLLRVSLSTSSRLPPLDITCLDDEGVLGYAILKSADHGDVPHRPADGYHNLCQVLLIGIHRSNKQLQIHSFSSDATALQNWNTTHANCFPGDPRLFSGPYGRAATLCGHTARWLFEDEGTTGVNLYTVDVNVKTGRVCASKITIQLSLPLGSLDWTYARLCLIDERLSLIYEHKNHLVIWTRQDVDQSGTAVMKYAQEIFVDAKELWSPTMLCVGEKSGTVLMLCRSKPNHAYLLDLQSKSTTKVAGWNDLFNYKTAVPYEINLPELFMSRLGVQM